MHIYWKFQSKSSALYSIQREHQTPKPNINDIVNRWDESILQWNLFGWVLYEWSLCSWHITVLVKTSLFFEPLLLFVTNGTAQVTWLCLIAWSWSVCSKNDVNFFFCWVMLKDGLLHATIISSEQKFRNHFYFVHFSEICISLNYYYWWIVDYCFLFRK